jgi:hypothetical protein
MRIRRAAVWVGLESNHDANGLDGAARDNRLGVGQDSEPSCFHALCRWSLVIGAHRLLGKMLGSAQDDECGAAARCRHMKSTAVLVSSRGAVAHLMHGCTFFTGISL